MRGAALLAACMFLVIGEGMSDSGNCTLPDEGGQVVLPFEKNLYAQLLMRAVTGTIYPVETFRGEYVDAAFPKQVPTQMYRENERDSALERQTHERQTETG
jgi:hypothetical protein